MIADLETFSTSYAPTGKGIVTGMGTGDFDFLTGDWHIRHKRLKDGGESWGWNWWMEWTRQSASGTAKE